MLLQAKEYTPEGTFVKVNGVVPLQEEKPYRRKKPLKVLPFGIFIYLL
jgi:hypothetical protein